MVVLTQLLFLFSFNCLYTTTSKNIVIIIDIFSNSMVGFTPKASHDVYIFTTCTHTSVNPLQVNLMEEQLL